MKKISNKMLILILNKTLRLLLVDFEMTRFYREEAVERGTRKCSAAPRGGSHYYKSHRCKSQHYCRKAPINDVSMDYNLQRAKPQLHI